MAGAGLLGTRGRRHYTASDMASTYTVVVGSFEGPFDLLLQLIARHKLDIYDIPLAQITDDYMRVLREMQVLDLEVTTEFLVVAATLLELKAARLLPAEEDPDLEELALEARDLLYARLLDYRTFKEAAALFRERLAAYGGYVPREVGLEPPFTLLTPRVELPVTAEDLAALAARAFAERPDPTVDTSHLQPVRITVREAAGMVVDELMRAGGAATFRELTAGCRHRIEIIVFFLALLELYKLDLVELDQAGLFGELYVRENPHGDWGASALATMEAYEPGDLEPEADGGDEEVRKA
jgi:segregation and condensation protein A